MCLFSSRKIVKKPNEMLLLAGSPTPVWPWSSGTEGVEWYQCPNADTSKVAETGSLAIIKLLLPMCQAWEILLSTGRRLFKSS